MGQFIPTCPQEDLFGLRPKMVLWRKFTAKQKAKRRSKNQGREESAVAGEILLQCLNGDVSGKQLKYTPIGAQKYVPFEHDELTIHNIKNTSTPITLLGVDKNQL